MITGLILAAGRHLRSTAPKLLHRLVDTTPLALRTAHTLRQAVDRCVVVVRPDDVTLATLLRQHGFEVACCSDPEGDHGAALAFGVRVTGGSTGWLIAHAQTSHIKIATAKAVAAKLRVGAVIAAPYFHGHRGYPIGFGRALGPQLGALSKDQDIETLIKAHASLVTQVLCSDPGVLPEGQTGMDLNEGVSLTNEPQTERSREAPMQ